MAEYSYIKKVDKAALDLEFKRSQVSPLYVSLTAVGTVVNVHMSRSLSPDEELTARNIVLAHTFKSDSEKMVQSKIISAMQFGQQFMIEVAADNVMLGMNTAQIMKMLVKYGHIQAMMTSGSLYTALAAMEAIVPDDLISAERKQLYISKIKKYLGVT